MKKDRHNKSCEEMSRLYAAREMSPAEALDFEAHLTECESCKNLLTEWKGLFSLLFEPIHDVRHLEPSRAFDRPIMAFVKGLVREREQTLRERASVDDRAALAHQHADAVVRRRAIWVGVAAMAAVLAIFSDMLSTFAPVGPQPARPYVLAIAWLVDVFHTSFDWLVFSFMRGIKIGEIFVRVLEALRPIWNCLGVAARQVDPQLVVAEILLFMLSLVLLKGLLGTAPKGRCTNVGIIL
ncbi:MAG: zf-HC2 domain-containing protein [Candidatus Eisenbacteria bacterium]|nr:zf-HC2 domain-containing protein [Candidatus Eisenbacteria bacterium]